MIIVFVFFAQGITAINYRYESQKEFEGIELDNSIHW